jgi:hypothetical protein
VEEVDRAHVEDEGGMGVHTGVDQTAPEPEQDCRPGDHGPDRSHGDAGHTQGKGPGPDGEKETRPELRVQPPVAHTGAEIAEAPKSKEETKV